MNEYLYEKSDDELMSVGDRGKHHARRTYRKRQRAINTLTFQRLMTKMPFLGLTDSVKRKTECWVHMQDLESASKREFE